MELPGKEKRLLAQREGAWGGFLGRFTLWSQGGMGHSGPTLAALQPSACRSVAQLQALHWSVRGGTPLCLSCGNKQASPQSPHALTPFSFRLDFPSGFLGQICIRCSPQSNHRRERP